MINAANEPEIYGSVERGDAVADRGKTAPQSLNELSAEMGWPEPDDALLHEARLMATLSNIQKSLAIQGRCLTRVQWVSILHSVAIIVLAVLLIVR